MFCVGCGEELDGESAACARCGTVAVGARFAEHVLVRDGDPVRTPTVCCCCLAPADRDFRESHEERGYGGRRRLVVPVPWCDACLGVRRRSGWIIAGSALATHVAVFFLVAPFVKDGAIAFVAGLASAVVVGGLAPALARPLRESARWRGHVPGCAAVSASVGRREAKLTFHNRAFARIWRDLQSGRAPEGPALAWTKPRAAPSPAARVQATPELAGLRRKHLAADAQTRAREAASRESRASPRPVRGAVASAPKVGVDAAAEVLRFVVKACAFEPDGVHARYGDGHERRVAFADLDEIVLRQLPAGPPFAATLVLDLIPRDAPPIRLLPSTRASYATLPGRGVTSHENYRRLVEHVLAQNPSARLEEASRPFVREGKAAPRCDVIQQFLDYDARFP